MTNNHPLSVSVAVATYNGERYLAAQLESIVRQTYPPDAVVLSDDASTDNTLGIAEELAARYPHIQWHILSNATNRGYVANFERAIAHCTSDIIALSDQDDIWLPNRLATIVQSFQDQPRCGLVFTDAFVVDQELNLTGTTIYTHRPLPDFRPDRVLVGLLQVTDIKGCTLAFRSVYWPYLLPVGQPEWGHDHWIIFLLAAISQICYISKPLMLYRRHQGNAGSDPYLTSNWRQSLRRWRHALSEEVYETDYLHWSAMLTHLCALQEKHDALIDPSQLAQAVAKTETRTAFARQRLQLRRWRRSKRWRPILRLLKEGQYTRFANRTRSALRDLIGS